VAASSLLVPVFLTETDAPDTTSLLGFVTTPPIEPVVVDCANATALTASTSKLSEKSFIIFVMGKLLGREALRLSFRPQI
jgi:hypothetical protein